MLHFASLWVLAWAFYQPDLLAQVDAPTNTGPQNPFHALYTLFEPESAQPMRPGQFNAQVDFSVTNMYAFSTNAYITLRERELWDTGQFKLCKDLQNLPDSYRWNCKSYGYSALFDGEIHQRNYRLKYQSFNWLELSYIYRQVRLTGGKMDSFIEKFHGTTQISNANREWNDRNKLEIYLWDNQTGALFERTAETGYRKLSETIGLKVLLWEEPGRNYLALKISSKFHDTGYWKDLNEVPNTPISQMKDFDDYNLRLLYTAQRESWTGHVAYSRTLIKRPYFSQSPYHINFYFVGISYPWGLVQLLAQDLQYSSIFPPSDLEPMNRDNNELTLAMRYPTQSGLSIDSGFVEDITHGIANIDFSIFLKVAQTW